MKNKIYIIHENDEWVEPLAKFLKEELLLLNNIRVVA